MKMFCIRKNIFSHRKKNPASQHGYCAKPLLLKQAHSKSFLVLLFRFLIMGAGYMGKVNEYLTIIPRAQMGYESLAHEAKGRMGY